ncbi:RNA methyltransferase [Dermacoccaceae bacterium W4C1]
MADLEITSASNPRLKSLERLRRRRTREQEGRTLVEGYEELALAVEAGVAVEQVLYCADLMRERGTKLVLVDRLRAAGAATIAVSRPAFEKIAYREGADGFLAVVPVPALHPRELQLPADALLLIAEGVEKPGNLGAMLRTADAAGVDAVIAVDPVTDWGNPNVVRSSKGTVFSVPVASADRESTVAWLQEKGIRVLAATPDTELVHTAVDLRGPVAIAVGTEKHGLTAEFMDAAAQRIRIPMLGTVNSLNVATSAAIVLYEAVRQRAAAS